VNQVTGGLPRTNSDGTVRGDSAADQPEGDPNFDSLTKTRHLLDFYRELLIFEREMLAGMRSWVQDRPGEVRQVIERDDIEPMEAHIKEFQERLRLWQDRARRLNAE
jgi:hypothetical protein